MNKFLHILFRDYFTLNLLFQAIRKSGWRYVTSTKASGLSKGDG